MSEDPESMLSLDLVSDLRADIRFRRYSGRKSIFWGIRSHHIRWIAIVLGYIERSYDDLGPYKSRVYNLNSTIMTDPYMVLEAERAYELLAGYGYCWVHTVPRCCYPACRSIGTLPAGPSLK